MNEPLEAEDHIRVSVDKNGHRIEVQGVKRRNPYTLQFVMPGKLMTFIYFIIHRYSNSRLVYNNDNLKNGKKMNNNICIPIYIGLNNSWYLPQ